MQIQLSSSQRQLVRLVARGYADSEITRKMGLSKNQLKRAFSDLCDQLNVANRLELILLVWSSEGCIPTLAARARGDVDARCHSL